MKKLFLTRLHHPRFLKLGTLEPVKVFYISILAMAGIFAFDLWTPTDIRLHALYIFPLAAITLLCENSKRMAIGGFVRPVAPAGDFLYPRPAYRTFGDRHARRLHRV